MSFRPRSLGLSLLFFLVLLNSLFLLGGALMPSATLPLIVSLTSSLSSEETLLLKLHTGQAKELLLLMSSELPGNLHPAPTVLRGPAGKKAPNPLGAEILRME